VVNDVVQVVNFDLCLHGSFFSANVIFLMLIYQGLAFVYVLNYDSIISKCLVISMMQVLIMLVLYNKYILFLFVQ
jgi:hypothetical protein